MKKTVMHKVTIGYKELEQLLKDKYGPSMPPGEVVAGVMPCIYGSGLSNEGPYEAFVYVMEETGE